MITSETNVERRASHAIPAAFGAGFIALIVVMGIAYDHGRSRHASALSEETAAIENEDTAFCTGLGVARNSDAFARCKSGLTDIRRSQHERINTMIGMF